MSIAPTHLEIAQSTDQEIGWPVVRWNDDGIPQGVDLTDYAVFAQVRPRAGSAAVLHEWSSAAGNARTETRTLDVWDLRRRDLYTITTDLVVLTVTPDDSAAWTWTSGAWDLRVTAPDPDGWVDRLDGGTITVIPAVSVPA